MGFTTGRRGGRPLAMSVVATQREHNFGRDRIIAAMVEVVAERGYAGSSVELVVGRAKVSRRTFYRCFAGLEACFLAVLDVGLEHTVELVTGAFAREENWQDGMRSALASVLAFLDSEPLLARLWVVEALAAGAWALEHRERNLAALRTAVESSWPVAEEWRSPPFAAEGVLGSILGVVHTHIVTGKPERLIELLGPLMGLVAGPYLSPLQAAREVERGDALGREIRAAERSDGGPAWQYAHRPSWWTGGLGAIPVVLSNPSAYRARRCVLFLAEQGERGISPCNREIAAGIGVAHESQVARLLSSLLGERLVTKRSAGIGKRNAWRLTPRGEEIAWALRGEEKPSPALRGEENGTVERFANDHPIMLVDGHPKL
jgi:AcrR family transcriptional regulator